MKKLTLALILTLAVLALAGCTDQSTPVVQPTVPAATATRAPATQPPADTPAPTEVPAATQAPTGVTEGGEPVIILSTHMTGENDGWAIGVVAEGTLQRMLRTADGGLTWKDVTPPDQAAKRGNADTAAIAAYYGENDAWVLYFSPMPAAASEAIYVWHTADRGQTWTAGDPLVTADMTQEFFIPGEIGFSDPQNGWLLAHLGAGMNHDYVALYKTADGGRTWTRTVGPDSTGDTDLPMSCSKTGVAFRDAQNGVVTGNCNGVAPGVFLYTSADGGLNWSPVKLPDPPGQPNLLASDTNFCGTQSPRFLDELNGALAVDCRDTAGQTTRWVYVTADGGATWQPDPRGAVTWTGVDFTQSGDHYVLAQAAGSSQGQALFAPLFNQPASPPVLELVSGQSGLDFADSQHGWAAAWTETDKLHLLRTRDGGRTWELIEPKLVP